MEPINQSLTRIIELFEYDPITGKVWRKANYGKRGRIGYVFTGDKIAIDGVSIRITHIIWVLQHGSRPPEGYWIDHKNRIKTDNRLTNLRLATPTQNQQNRAGCGTYAKGVTWRARMIKPWQAKIRVNGTRIHLGSFETHDEAAKAYQEACLTYHGEFACPR